MFKLKIIGFTLCNNDSFLDNCSHMKWHAEYFFCLSFSSAITFILIITVKSVRVIMAVSTSITLKVVLLRDS